MNAITPYSPIPPDLTPGMGQGGSMSARGGPFPDRFDPSPFELEDSSGGAGGGADPAPFDITIDTVGNTLTVSPGTINSLAPSNNGGTFICPAGVTHYVVLNATAVNGSVTAATLSVDSAVPAPIGATLGFPPSSFKVLLHVIQAQVAFRTIGRHSLHAVSIEALRVQKVMTTPDQLPYDTYYTWQLSGI